MLEVTAAQMKELERKANETGLSYEDMMENAGQAAARILLEQLPGLRTAAVVCGKGNNGGDGFVAARKLFEAGCCVRLYLVDGAPTAPGEARTNYLRTQKLGLPTCALAEAGEAELAFLSTAQAVVEENDCDYIMDNQTMVTLAGSHLAKRRNAVRHYTKLAPPPEVEEVTAEKLSRVLRLSAQAGGDDRRAELEAIRHFARLGLHGVLIRRGEEDVGFAFASAMTPETMQGHFTKTIDRIRGANLFVMQACVASGVERYGYLYTNMEDDMGDPGLREFKRSLRATVIPAYTITIPNDLPR